MGHIAERTSPKGGPFIGKCKACGKEDLTPADVRDEDCPVQLSNEDLIKAVFDEK